MTAAWRWKRTARSGTLYLHAGSTHRCMACVYQRYGMYGWWVRGVPENGTLCATEEDAVDRVYQALSI